MSDFYDDFEISSYENKHSDKFSIFMEALQDIVIEDEFSELRNNFFSKYNHLFDNKEENKHEYHDIFNLYIKEIEGYLISKLKERIKDFNIDEVMKDLNSHKDQVDEELLEMLLSFSDYMIFKEMILDYKKSKDNKLSSLEIDIVTIKNLDKYESDLTATGSSGIDVLTIQSQPLHKKESNKSKELNKVFTSGKDIFKLNN